MANTTNVPAPTFGPNGFIPNDESVILSGVQADWNSAFNTTFNFGTTGGAGTNPTPQGQITTSEAAIVGNTEAQFCALAQQFDPDYAAGRYQDALGRLYFMTRIPSQPTVIQVPCAGLTGVVIPTNSLIIDSSGNLYTSTQDGTIPGSGSVVIPFACTVPGPTAAPGTNAVSIYRAVPGWDSVTVQSGVLGNATESRSAFEARRRQSVAKNSVGALPSIKGAVLDVPGVADVYVTENDSGAPVTVNGFTLAAKSVYVAVSGGDPNAVARAMWTKKAPGCAWNGNTAVTVYDTVGYTPPYPSYNVIYETPTPLQFLFAVQIINGPLVPSDAAAQVQNAIIAAFAGADGGPRAKIGATVLATRFYAPVAILGGWAQILAMQVGSVNAPSAQFTGSIAGAVLTVNAVASGGLAIGQTISDAAGAIAAGTTITAGSGTSWTVSIAQTISSRAMTAALAAANSVVVHIDQVPAIAANNIKVTFV